MQWPWAARRRTLSAVSAPAGSVDPPAGDIPANDLSIYFTHTHIQAGRHTLRSSSAGCESGKSIMMSKISRVLKVHVRRYMHRHSGSHVPKIAQSLAYVEVKPRADSLQHRPRFFGCTTHQIVNSQSVKQAANWKLTCPRASSIWHDHPRHDLVRHPLPQRLQHPLAPLARARL